MRRLLGVGGLAMVMALADVAAAVAGCSYGPQTLPGSIGPFSRDTSRFFTSDGGEITVSINTQNGPLRVNLPGCGWSTGANHSCTTGARPGSRVAPIIENPNGFTITYYFSCED